MLLTATGDDLQIQTKLRNGLLVTEASLSLRADAQATWRVLADYDRLGEGLSFVKHSELVERAGGNVLLRQQLTGELFFFKRELSVLLRVQERFPERMDFEDELKKDFKIYRGYWQVEGSTNTTALHYHLEAQPPFRLPAQMMRKSSEKKLRAMLEQLARRIEGAEADAEPAAAHESGTGQP